MKNLILLFLFAFSFVSISNAQTSKVNWTTKSEKINNNTYNVIFTAEVASGWYIYSREIEEGGPIPTTIELKGNSFSKEGELIESGEITKESFDPVFEIDIKKYGGKVTFSQVVKKNGNASEFAALVTFMSCDDHTCLPPKQIELPITLN